VGVSKGSWFIGGEMWCGEFVNAAGCYVAETGRERERARVGA